MSAPHEPGPRADDDTFVEFTPEEWARIDRSPGGRIFDAAVRLARRADGRALPMVPAREILGVATIGATVLLSGSAGILGWGVATRDWLTFLTPDLLLSAVGVWLLSHRRGPTRAGRALFAVTLAMFVFALNVVARVLVRSTNGGIGYEYLANVFGGLSYVAVGSACLLAVWPTRRPLGDGASFGPAQPAAAAGDHDALA